MDFFVIRSPGGPDLLNSSYYFSVLFCLNPRHRMDVEDTPDDNQATNAASRVGLDRNIRRPNHTVGGKMLITKN